MLDCIFNLRFAIHLNICRLLVANFSLMVILCIIVMVGFCVLLVVTSSRKIIFQGKDIFPSVRGEKN